MRRVLFDENMPRKLRREIKNASVRTVQEEGWAGFKNGELLRRASGRFDVLLTADQRLRYQQNVRQFAIGVVAIETIDTTMPGLRPLLPKIEALLFQPVAVLLLSRCFPSRLRSLPERHDDRRDRSNGCGKGTPGGQRVRYDQASHKHLPNLS